MNIWRCFRRYRIYLTILILGGELSVYIKNLILDATFEEISHMSTLGKGEGFEALSWKLDSNLIYSLLWGPAMYGGEIVKIRRKLAGSHVGSHVEM